MNMSLFKALFFTLPKNHSETILVDRITSDSWSLILGKSLIFINFKCIQIHVFHRNNLQLKFNYEIFHLNRMQTLPRAIILFWKEWSWVEANLKGKNLHTHHPAPPDPPQPEKKLGMSRRRTHRSE